MEQISSTCPSHWVCSHSGSAVYPKCILGWWMHTKYRHLISYWDILTHASTSTIKAPWFPVRPNGHRSRSISSTVLPRDWAFLVQDLSHNFFSLVISNGCFKCLRTLLVGFGYPFPILNKLLELNYYGSQSYSRALIDRKVFWYKPRNIFLRNSIFRIFIKVINLKLTVTYTSTLCLSILSRLRIYYAHGEGTLTI